MDEENEMFAAQIVVQSIEAAPSAPQQCQCCFYKWFPFRLFLPPPPDSSFFLLAICSDSAASCSSSESREINIQRQSIYYIISVHRLYPFLLVQESPVIVGDNFEWHEDFFYIIYMYNYLSYSRFIWTSGSIFNKLLLKIGWLKLCLRTLCLYTIPNVFLVCL